MTLGRKFSAMLTTIAAGAVFTCAFAQSIDSRVRLNSVGFRPGHPKIASIASDAETEPNVLVMPIGGNQAVARANMSKMTNSDTNEELWIADFSHFNTPGLYQLNVVGMGLSPTFTISDNVFHETYRTAMLAMYLWRCGNPGGVDATFGGVRYRHGACHLNDGIVHASTNQPNAGQRVDATGGWHDAGDYNKYVVNSGVSIGLMLKAWEYFHEVIRGIPLHVVQDGGNMPAYLVEVKWNIDWVAKMQFEDGWFSHKLTALSFGGDVLPDAPDDGTRYFIRAGTASTASAAAILALAARIYAPYVPQVAEKWLEQAERAYDVIKDSPFVTTACPAGTPVNTGCDINPSITGGYEVGRDIDKRKWAAAELWETTGDEKYLEYLEDVLSTSDVRQTTEWADVQNLASMTYLNSRRPDKNEDKVELIRNQLITIANQLDSNTLRHGYGRPITGYGWGTNGAVASTSFILYNAYRHSGDDKYRHSIHNALSVLLGRNYQARSFITRVGHNPPVNPHCRRSVAQNLHGSTPWPGYLVGGPTTQAPEARPAGSSCSNLGATCYFDFTGDYARNEIAINWNTALIFALASMQPGADVLPSPCYPGQPECDPSSIRQTARPQQGSTPRNAAATRVVRVGANGKTDIPPGARVYTLDGRLVAKRGLNDAAPRLRRNGVYIIKIDENVIRK